MGTANVLVVGGGGREHALVWKLAHDRDPPALYCAPGNAGTAQLAVNLPISAEDIPGLVSWARANRPQLTVVGPEAPLCAGLADALAAEGLRVFGPCRAAAQIEGSKVFAKEVLTAAGVPTAQAQAFTEEGSALAFAERIGWPVVIKADGLAAGKGVTICADRAEARRAIHAALRERVFGEAGARILVEEYLDGEEASILALVDGARVVMLASAQDHKRAFDNDQGPNTGGMGAYSPAPVASDHWWPVIYSRIFVPTLAELNRRGITYRGVLYAGLMITATGPRVLEFNCRFGDPETQAILPRLATDLLPALDACVDGTLRPDLVRWQSEACVCVVLASEGYPGRYATGRPITGLEEAGRLDRTVVFHAGTRMEDGRVVTAGGRVLGVTALGATLREAVDNAYRAVERISFEGRMYRRDIAFRALKGVTRL